MRSSKEILKIITDSRKSKKMSLDELGEKAGLLKPLYPDMKMAHESFLLIKRKHSLKR
mgnify:CR=1 FL=1